VEEKPAWESGRRLQTAFEDMSSEMLMNGFLRNLFETLIHSSWIIKCERFRRNVTDGKPGITAQARKMEG
jgi:hypothetical protein